MRERVASLMPELKADLARLVAIPSVSATSYPPETHAELLAARDLVVELLEGAGVQNLRSLELPDTAPVVLGEIPGPEGAPTVLLYGHYDVVPAGDDEKWESPPWELTERDGALFGRGSADTKSNIVAHVGALRAWEGRPPVGIKVVIEGQEEVGSALNDYPATHPTLFEADAMLIADMGSVRPGVPTLTIGLRGMAQTTMEVETLGGPKHSGQYGGAAPDALGVLLQALATLHDENGDVAVEGLRREPWTGAAYTEEEFRTLAEVKDDLPLVGTGDLGSRVWSGPAITVTGIDITSVDDALNAVNARVRAKINTRVHPAQNADEAQEAVVRHLEADAPVRDWTHRQPRRDGQRFPRRDDRAGVSGGTRGDGGGLGHRGLLRGDRRLHPARQCAPRGCARGRDPAPRDDRRLCEHPCAEREGADRGVREGGAGRDGVPRPLCRRGRSRERGIGDA